MARNRKKSKENKKFGKVSFKNPEGYADPVPFEVLRRNEKKERKA